MKKILSLVLAMLMIISMVPAVFAAETSESDYQAAIEYLKAIGLYKGTTDGDAADELVKRYEMALFTARMVTGRVDKAYWETDANDSDFTDIEALNAEALGGVCYAAQQGIVNGIGGSEFAPYDNVTYRDAIVMIVRALGFNYPASGYPWSYINKARELRVLDGITGVSYTVEVKREVIAQLLYNAMNAEIKGETIAANVFGVEETIVMVTATPDGIVYKKDGAKSVKANTVRVSAVDAAGEPIGAEYYVPFKALGLKNPSAANAAVGAYFKLTHKGNFSNFLACESLTQVFENTPDKKEVKYDFSNYNLTLGGKSYLVLNTTDDYSSLTNNQGTVSGSREIKVFKAWGAKTADAEVGKEGYFKGVDGKVYAYANPFVPFAIYSDIAKAWFHVSIDQHGVTRYNKLSDTDVATMLEKIVGGTVKGFSEIGRNGYMNTKVHKDYGAQYDYYKAFATDTNGDGNFDRVTVRAYRLYKFDKDVRKGKNSSGSTTEIDTFTLTQFTGNGLTANIGNMETVGTWDAEYSYDYGQGTEGYEYADYKYFRFTGIAYDKLPSTGIIVAYFNTGVESEQEIEVVAVADKMSAYIRGYDQASDSIIYGSDYETMKLGYFGVAGTSIYRATQCADVVAWKVNAANYVRNFWNKYVDLYVLNDSVVYIANPDAVEDYVILESYTGFSDEGLTAVAYSTKAGGKTEILINEVTGWQLGGFDYALYEEMVRLHALLGDLVKDYVPSLPVKLNEVYAVRYVDENGAYNLVKPGIPEKASIFVNNYGYIVGVDKDGKFGDDKRVATSDKDLWFILAEKEGKVFPFQGKLSPIAFTDAHFYKAVDNQYVLVVESADKLGAILGNSMAGIEYHMYNKAIDNAYRNENIFGTYYYGHAMLNMRTGNVEFITYDAELAAELNKAGKWNEGQYINMIPGGIYQTVGGVLENVAKTYGMADVAALEFAKGTYVSAPIKVAVGAVLPAAVNPAVIDDGTYQAAYTNYGDLVDNKPVAGSLVDAILNTLYKGVYNDGFHNTDVSYKDAIKLELAHKVTFVQLKADNTRTTWAAAKDGSYVDETLGSDSAIATAYVMYDFANAKAIVFVDSKTIIPLTETDTLPKEDVIADVDADVIFVSNVMKNETEVTVAFDAPLAVTAVTVGGSVPANLWIGANSVSFTVPQAGFKSVDDITVTATALDFSNKVTGLTFGGMMNLSLNAHCKNDPTVLFDGKYTVATDGTAWKADAYAMQISSFAKKIKDDLSGEEANELPLKANGNPDYMAATQDPLAGDYYWGVAKVNLAAAETLKSFRLVVATDYTASKSTPKNLQAIGIEILVSTDNGTTWTVAGSVTDAMDKGDWVVVDKTASAPGYSYIDIPLFNATNVTNVAYAIKETSDHTGDGTHRSFTAACEIELYK